MNLEQIESLKNQAFEQFQKAADSQALYELKVKFLGKNGKLTDIMKDISKLSPEERPRFGKIINEVKQSLELRYSEIESQLKTKEMSSRLVSEKIDMTLPGPHQAVGSQHPVWMVIEEIQQIFSRLGFSVRLGPLIEKDRYNFEALNIPKDHPARDMQDTFYIDSTYVLRTQTSPIQIHCLETEPPPLRIIGPGAVFRRDSDISHAPMFHQVEGMLIDRKVSMSDLKGVLAFFNRSFFGNVKTRFRPSFFPFTEPSAEVDCTCPLCSGKGCRTCGQSGWIEVAGCGLVHPNVFKEAGLKYPDWQGFAFGFGVERLAMVKYGIEDIRSFTENDVRFLGLFPS